MQLRRLHLQDFRNIALTRLECAGPRLFFSGPNGQGKTNLLEAVGLLAALRSFRGAEARDLIRQGTTEARIWIELEHERDGAVEIEITLRAQRREVAINGAKCAKLAEFLGRFPVVALSSHDLQLLRGSPALRRRALDLALASLDAGYFHSLRRYQQALDGRNALLRSARPAAAAELAAFETLMAAEAGILMPARAAACTAWAGHLREGYTKLAAGATEQPELTYVPDGETASPEAWREKWAAGRKRDLQLKTTQHGPHRDDFTFRLLGQGAKAFASEGQQRGLVVSWRLAQAAWQRERTGVQPILLADDVLGELDPQRREGFWRTLESATQVLASGTTRPTGDAAPWARWTVHDGMFARVAEESTPV
jgi:DNA replication and repair protein RecF